MTWGTYVQNELSDGKRKLRDILGIELSPAEKREMNRQSTMLLTRAALNPRAGIKVD